MKKTLLAVAVVGLLLPVVSLGAYWKADQEVSVGALQPLQDNAYLAGRTVTVSGPVAGDLFAAGSTVSISGKVSHDIMAAGSLVDIVGATAEDVRLAGSSINVGGVFSGELLAAGAQIMVTPDAQIAKDTYLTGSVLDFNGKGAGSVVLSGAKVAVNGTVGKDLTVKSSGTLIIGPAAIIKGNVDYSSPSPATIDPAAKISGTVNFHKVEATNTQDRNAFQAAFFGLLTVISLLKLLAVLLAAYLLWYIRRKDSLEVVQHALTKFGASLLRGFIFLVVVPVAILIACVTLIGAPIGIFAGFVYAALLLLASPFAVLLASSLLLKKRTDLQWYHILLGAVVMGIVAVVPVIGWLAVFIVYLAALGALITVLRTRFQR